MPEDVDVTFNLDDVCAIFEIPDEIGVAEITFHTIDMEHILCRFGTLHHLAAGVGSTAMDIDHRETTR